MRRILSIALTVALLAGVVIALLRGHGSSQRTTTVRGVIGPEKEAFLFPILFGESATSEMNALASLTRGRTFDARFQSLSAVFGEIRGYQ